MITSRQSLSRFACVVAASLTAAVSPAMAQLATVDATDTSDIEFSYDESPHLYAPNVPEYPTVIYTDGAGTGNVDTVAGPVLAQQPQVKTANPDTHSLSAATVYYTAPKEPAGPYKTLGSSLLFDFGTRTSPLADGYIRVHEGTAYSAETGYGWGDITKVSSRDRGGVDSLTRDFCLPASGSATTASPTPFYVDVPNGTYNVSVTVGDAIGKSSVSVRAEGAPQASGGAAAGNFDTMRFVVKVRDGRLMLEFFGTICHVNGVTVERVSSTAERKRTVFVASDSTASSYGPGVYPMTGWGARLPNFFDNTIYVDNMARAGRSSKSFYEEGLLGTIESRIQPGDYLFVMFAINDSADDNSNRKTRADSTFKAYLRLYVDVARKNNATPVFITSQTKRTFDLWGRFTNSVGAYPQAMRELGAELNVPVVDLNKKSIDFLTAIGPEAAKDVYMYLNPGEYPGWPNGASDYIHLQDTGARAFAELIAEGIRELDIQPLAKHVVREERPDDQTVRSPY